MKLPAVLMSTQLAWIIGTLGVCSVAYYGTHAQPATYSLAPVAVQAQAMQPVKAVQPVLNEALVLPKSAPVRLSIPAIGVDAPFVPLGLKPDNTLGTPTNGIDVGWYKNSPTPGELGPSIVAAHVDTAKDGPAVFWNLYKLQPGDMIQVTRADGTTATFRVDRTAQYPQNDFPASEVYGNTTTASIRLITCGGVWSQDAHHYSLNTVVYGTLI